MDTNDSTSKYILIPVSQGHFAQASPEDSDLLQSHWQYHEAGINKYCRRSAKGCDKHASKEYMHRIVLSRMLGRSLEKHERVDHIDHDGLNNIRSNLRLATAQENSRNSRVKNTSHYKGVKRKDRLWSAHIWLNYQPIFLGSYDTEEEAAIVYNHAAAERFGEFASFNDVPNWQAIHPVRLDRRHSRRDNTSGYPGIRCQKGRWIAFVWKHGKEQYVGSFGTVEDALKAQGEAKTHHE